ncbi:hypothetical protein GC194_00830 [bacterium]|nr:hypothetical protein [bacterium]
MFTFEMDKEQQHIVNVFHYFDYFSHALSADEIHGFCNEHCNKTAVVSHLDDLLRSGVICEKAGYYAFTKNRHIIDERLKYLKLNQKMFRYAGRMSLLLRLIPYVRGIAVSGSLSKWGARPESDIDFFIITAPDRVWTVKALAILMKKIFFFNSHKFLCVNYLLATDALELEKKNRYQAMEAITLKPLFGSKVFMRFFAQNNWISHFFPNAAFPKCAKPTDNIFLIQRLGEWILRGIMGEKVEQMARNEFKKHCFKKSVQHNGRYTFRKNEAAYFPHDFEKEVLRNYRQKTHNLAATLQVKS